MSKFKSSDGTDCSVKGKKSYSENKKVKFYFFLKKIPFFAEKLRTTDKMLRLLSE